MNPKGTLIAIGGNIEMNIDNLEDKMRADFGEEVVLKEIIEIAGGSESRFEIITSATNKPSDAGDKYQNIFSKLNVENLGILDIPGRKSADSPEILERIEKADVLVFTGGDQNQIIDFIQNTKAHALILDQYHNRQLLIAGTSAGAAMMGELMIKKERKSKVLKKNDMEIGFGLGFIEPIIFDTHFIQRGRFERLAEAIAASPNKIGFGLGEDTAIVIRNGNECEIIGTGMVSVIDGSNFNPELFQNLKDDAALSLIDFTFHILSPQDKYFIDERKAVSHNFSRQYQNNDCF